MAIQIEKGRVMGDHNSMIEKIKALLSKTVANGCTEAEMLIALAKARALQDTYDISDAELQLSREEKVFLHDESEEDGRDIHHIKWNLANGISAFCNVRVYRDSSKAGLTFIGFKSDIDLATWLLDHLADFVYGKLFEHLLDCLAPDGKERKEVIRGFVIGCTERIAARMIAICDKSQNVRTAKGNALVVIKDGAIKEFMKAEDICLRNSRSRAGFSDAARVAGQGAGDLATFGKPVSEEGAPLQIGAS